MEEYVSDSHTFDLYICTPGLSRSAQHLSGLSCGPSFRLRNLLGGHFLHHTTHVDDDLFYVPTKPTFFACQYGRSTNPFLPCRWDDWVPQDRLRKFSEENKELAYSLKQDLKREMDKTRAVPKSASRKKTAGSDFSSIRGSEERNSSVPVTGRGTKRGRDMDLEKVGFQVPLNDSFILDTSAGSDYDSGYTSGYYNNSELVFAKRRKTSILVRNFHSFPLGLDGAGDEPDSSSLSSISTLVDDEIANEKPVEGSTPLSEPATKDDEERKPVSTSLPKTSSGRSRKPSAKAAASQIIKTPENVTKPTKKALPKAQRKLQPTTKKPAAKVEKKSAKAKAKEATETVQPTADSPLLELKETPKAKPEATAKAKSEERKDVKPGPSEPAAKIEKKPSKPPVQAARKPRAPKAASPSPAEIPTGYHGDSALKYGKLNPRVPQEEAFHSRPAVRLPIPDHIKALLVDDWEYVTKNLSLVPLPHPHPVAEILTAYLEEEKLRRRAGSVEYDLLEEVIAGLREYFDQTLGRILLYRFEREQWFQVRQKMESGEGKFADKKPSDIYGPEHLCRLFGRLLPRPPFLPPLPPLPSFFPLPSFSLSLLA